MKKVNMEFLKRVNRSLVLDTIRADQPISRAKVAKKLNLSRSSVSAIVDDLIAKKFVMERGLGSSTKEGGRPGVELEFNPKSGFGVGVHIKKTGMLLCITDLEGQIVLQESIGAWNGYESLSQSIEHCLLRASVPPERLIAISFCMPGLTNSVQGVVIDAPDLGWKNVNFLEGIKSYVTKPVYINNDVNCAALAERWLGATKNIDDFVYISIGTGVGSAIVANGSLIQGKDFMAGEIGYFVMEQDLHLQSVNKFGEFGVFEKKISKLALTQHAESVASLFDSANTDQHTAKVVDDFVTNLSLAIANIVNLLNPEKVMIGGGEVAPYLQPILHRIQAEVAALTPIQTSVELSDMGEESGALGSISFAFDQEQQII
jgi:glucokinase